MLDNFHQIMEEIGNRLENLKRSGQIDHHALMYGIDQQGLTIEVVVIRKGIEHKVKEVYARNYENTIKDVFTKLRDGLNLSKKV